MEDDRGQGTLPYWKKEKISWCGCKGKRVESGAPTERKSTAKKEQSGARARDSRGVAKEERAARPREAKAQQSGAWSGEPEHVARERGSRKEARRIFKMLREV